MKKNIKFLKVIICVIILTLCASFAVSAMEFTYEEYEDYILVGNEYLEYAIDPYNGLYTMGTTGGNPILSTDNNKLLIYGHPDSNTSYATLVIDNEVFSVENNSDEIYITDMYYENNTGSYVVEYEIDVATVKQILTIVDNNSTGRKDVVEMKYIVTNNDSRSHDIGFRIMLDTMLADNDDAPFRVPGTGDVITETEYTGNDIPQYWQAFDSLTNPSTIAQGTFIRAGYKAPDKVQFVSWEYVVGTPWNYTITPGMYNGDSAVTAVWNQKSLAAGQSETFVTYYGISELQQAERELSLSLYADSTIDAIDGAYVPNPTVATAYVKNISDYAVDNVEITLDVTYPLSIDGDTSAVVALGSLEPGEERQISWDLDIETVTEDITATITATLTGDDVETLSVSRNMFIPAMDEHEHYVITETINATCTADGAVVIICDDCGEIFAESVIPATGHNYKETGRKDAEPGVEGYIQYKCSKCGDTYRTIIEALPKRNFFQRIWDLIVKFFVFIGLS